MPRPECKGAPTGDPGFPAGAALPDRRNGWRGCLLAVALAAAAGTLVADGKAPPVEDPAGSRSSSTAPAAVETNAAAARRNENVAVQQLDTNAAKEANKRLGTTPRFVDEFRITNGYYAAELGVEPSGFLAGTAPASLAPGWHGELFELHENSVLNARSFFQVGPVQPARQNQYGVRARGPLTSAAELGLRLEQTKIRGMVNGNVQVPLSSERTPLAEDPRIRRVVERFLAAYPAVAPNRTDLDPRALNTNAPQRVDDTQFEVDLSRRTGGWGAWTAAWSVDRSRTDAFQFVAGQNPDTEIHAHQGRLTGYFDPAGGLEGEAGLRLERVRSVLLPEENAVGPEVRIGHQIQNLGPDAEFPVDRAQNLITAGGMLSWVEPRNRHRLEVGGWLTRVQLNGIESNNLRGSFTFSNAFGRTAIENLLWGVPSKYVVTLGDAYRGFRSWRGELFAGDRWNLRPDLTLSAGVRYSFEARPREVHARDVLPYGCDCNNFAPRLGLAWRHGGFVWRASWAVSYGEIYPVTYQQIRNNPPLLRQIQVQDPDLLDPLAGIDVLDAASRYSPTWLSPDLVAPYSHQVHVGLERRLGPDLRLRAAYVGSRTLKLFRAFVLNRAEPVAGIPLETGTIDLRRPDQRFSEVYWIANGGMAYLDALQLAVSLPGWRGLSLSAEYFFSKALDEGVDYTGTAAGADLTRGRNQDQGDAFRDMKGPSNFDSPHSLLVMGSWSPPFHWRSPLGVILKGWTLTGAAMLKNGTPFTLYVGSDAPGFGNVDGSGGDRPNLLDPTILGTAFGHPDTSAAVLSPDRFAPIQLGARRGNLGRNTFRKGPIKNLNLALSRHWALERNGLEGIEFRVEAYNATNSPQFDEPQRNLTSPSFGRITNTLNQGRILQAGLRLLF